MELIIGREAGVQKEQARLSIQTEDKNTTFGAKGSVPPSISKKHCKVSIDDNNLMTVVNITDNNLIYINGIDCQRKDCVTFADTIELGPDKYRLDMEAVLKTISQNQVYSIKHLETIYNSYQQEKIDMQVKQGKLGALSALPGVLSMASIGLAAFLPKFRVWMVVIAAFFAIAFALIRYLNASKVPLKTRELEERLRKKYICPNPACNHFLGTTPYTELVKNHTCPYCKCKYKE